MDIAEQSQGAVMVLKPQGPLTQADALQFRKRLEEALSRHLDRVLVDASAIPFVDSVGLEALADVSEQLSRVGQSLKICGANETVRGVRKIPDVASKCKHFEEIQTAVRSFL